MPWLLKLGVEAYREHQERLGERLAEYDPVVTYRMAMGRGPRPMTTCARWSRREALRLRAQRALHDVDAFLAPTTMVPALPLAEVDASLET